MIQLLSAELPQFLADEFERMIVPSGSVGFAVSFSSGSKKHGVACWRLAATAHAVTYVGEEYAVKSRKVIDVAVFEQLCRGVPEEAKKSGFIFAEDVLDGETYLVEWVQENQVTRFVLANPRDIDNKCRSLALQLDKLMQQTSES
jgi:hypothetical protein